MKSRFLALYCMVLADGVIDARELETLYRIGSEIYQLSNDEIAAAVRESGTSFALPTELNEKISLLYEMSQICICDGRIDETELRLLSKYAREMGFEEDNISEIVNYLLERAKQGVPENEVISEIIG